MDPIRIRIHNTALTKMSADNVIRPTCFPYLTISEKQANSFLMKQIFKHNFDDLFSIDGVKPPDT